jgi:aspartyl aminopeptidase
MVDYQRPQSVGMNSELVIHSRKDSGIMPHTWHTSFVSGTPTMNLTTQRIFTLTMTEDEASVIAQFLDSDVLDTIVVPDEVKKLQCDLNTELVGGPV